ncbi:MAG TPA: ABC transporter ATP-binding protein [Candidatus Nanopelagicaceae bacterium]|nr:ABC transporter ATP-binding protein [Candidatus Nanopelagicaceae bacterium]
MVMVRVDAVSKRFAEVPALTDLSVDVGDGEFFIMVGPSGCGKTTLLRILAGLERPDSGDIWFGDRCVTAADPGSREVGMVFQNYALYPHLSIYENLAFGLRVRRTNRHEVRSRVMEVSTLLDLQELLERKPKQLSGGQRQRVALGRAIMRRPHLLLMDEPLSNLDAILRERMRIELRRFHDRLGITTIYVTHDQKEAISMADRVMVMNAGRIEQIGPPEEIIRHPRTEFAARFMGQPPMNMWRASMVVSPAGAALVRAGSRSTWTVPGPWPETPGGSPDIWLGVRPRDLAVTGPGEVADLKVIVEVVERGGDEVFLHCRHRDEMLVVGVDATRLVPHVGDEVGLTIRLDRVHLFDAKTGARIQPSGANGRASSALLVGGELQ